VLRLVIGDGTILAAAGLLIGLPVALLLARLISKLLFGIKATDPFTFAVTAAVILLVALTASIIPASRAVKVDPVIALRYE